MEIGVEDGWKSDQLLQHYMGRLVTVVQEILKPRLSADN